MLLFPFQLHEQTSSCTSSRANEAWFSVDLCPMSAQNCLTPMNNQNCPSMMSSALLPPWLLISTWHICSKSLNAVVVVRPCCRCVGCLADVYRLGRGHVVDLFPALVFFISGNFRNSFFSSGIAILMRSLPTKGLTDKQMHSTVPYALFL